MDTPASQLNFAIIFDFNQELSVEALRAGADSARKVFPTAGCRLKNNRWVPDPAAATNAIAVASCSDSTPTVENFINRRFDPQTEVPVQQLVVASDAEPSTTLVTRFHHAACDGMSAALWLRHQLEIAQGIKTPETQIAAHAQVTFRRAPRPARKSELSLAEPSTRLFTAGRVRSNARSWITIAVDASRVRERIRRAGGFTYSDFLATCALEVFARWNEQHGNKNSQRLGLWLPINVRKHPAEGFGNGTSRVRIHAIYPSSACFAAKCREVRRQIRSRTTNGEWLVPDAKVLTRLPRQIIAPFLRHHLSRESLDMGTAVFSHSDRWNSNGSQGFDGLHRIECVGLLHPLHALAINGATHRGQTWFTFTYDTGLLARDDARQLAELYQEQIQMGRDQL
jgi:hypothetical protein